MNSVHVAASPARMRFAHLVHAQRAWWVAGAAVVILAITVQPLRDSDVWWHLALGRFTAAHGLPSHEPFSFLSATHPWVDQQWLYELLLYRMVSIGGAGFASLAMGAVAALAVVIAALALPRSQRIMGAWLAAGIVLSGLVMAQVAGVRGQVFSVLGTAIVLLIVTRWREGSTRAVWALPPLFLLWANIHAGFISGFAVLIVALLAASPLAPARTVDRQRLLAATLISALATVVNPAGPALIGYVGETFFNPTLTSAITEWASPDFHNVWLRIFEAEVVLLVVLWVLSRGPDVLDVALAGAAVVATLQAQRNVSLFAILAVPQVARYGTVAWSLHVAPRVRARRDPHSAGAPLMGALVTAAIVVCVAVTLAPQLSQATTASFEASRYPEAASNYVASHLAGQRLYSTDTWGGYLAYRFPGSRMVFLYGETAVFGDADLQVYEDVHLLRPNWSRVLATESITHAVVPLRSQEASGFHALDWTVDCYDSASGAVVMSALTDAAPQPDLLSAPSAARRC